MSVADEKNDKTGVIAQKVMHRISSGFLKANPAVYAVLYAYYAGQNPDITYQIDVLERDNKPLTTTLCEQLYDTYLSTKRDRQFIDEAIRKVQAAMTEITGMIRSSGTSHNEYNQSLMRQSDSLSSATDIEEIKKMVGQLIGETQKMVRQNQQLEEQLQGSSRELDKMRNDMQNLKVETLTDALTGIPNRKAFDNELKTRAKEALEKSRPMCMIMIDIDHFKVFNDTYGHQVGDQVLRLVARTLGEGLRPIEMLARYGGEEFAVIVPALKLNDCEKLAEKLRQRIAAKDIVNQTKNEKLGSLSISLGVAQLEPGEPLSQLLERADHALYKAKAAGRNKVVVAEYDKNIHGTATIHNDIVIDTIS